MLPLLLLLLLLGGAAAETCQRVSACSCRTSSGQIVDLQPLAASPLLRDRPGPQAQKYTYTFSPCAAFTCGGKGNAALCQRDLHTSAEYIIGTQDTAQFSSSSSGQLQVSYSATSSDEKRRIGHVQLQCSGGTAATFTPQDDGGNVEPFVYHMTLASSHCCPVGGGGLSGGDILLIVFFSLLLLYLVAGLLINRLLRHRSGVELLPNTGFWLQLPALVRDGCQFCVSEARRLLPGRRGKYDSV